MNSKFVTGVSKGSYRAYLEGGRLWPQKRGGINIATMAALCGPSNFSLAFQTIANSCFSNKQVRAVRNLMISDHIKFGIRISTELPDSMFQDEWAKTQGGIYKTLLMFFEIDYTPKEMNQDLKAYVTHEHTTSILNALSEPGKQIHIPGLRLMIGAAYSTLVAHEHLAVLFKLTYYTQASRQEAIDLNRSWLKKIAEHYGITASLPNDPDGYRSQCLERIKKLLQLELERLFPDEPNTWITWGFDD